MLIDEDRISVRVDGYEAGGAARGLVRLLQLHSLGLELALQFADVSECGQVPSVAVPTGIEGKDVRLKHSLKKPDHIIPVLENQPALGCIPGKDIETQLLVEGP